MIKRSVRFVASNPAMILFGVLFGFVAGAVLPVVSDVVFAWYDEIRPVITDWTITSAVREGDDIVIAGTMIKHRECLLIPPAIARGKNGDPYRLEPVTRWAAKDSSSAVQPWGPWRVYGAVGNRLTFTMVYMCGGARPSIVSVGVYAPDK